MSIMNQQNPNSEPARSRPLPALRAMIDSVDRDLLRLLARRYAIVSEIAEYKRGHRLPIRDFQREREIESFAA